MAVKTMFEPFCDGCAMADISVGSGIKRTLGELRRGEPNNPEQKPTVSCGHKVRCKYLRKFWGVDEREG